MDAKMIEELKRLHEAATPEPWKAELIGSSPVKIVDSNASILGYSIYGPRSNVDERHPGGVPTAEANAALKVEMRNALPSLLAKLDDERWLPASERMPDAPPSHWSDQVLVCLADGSIALDSFYNASALGDKFWRNHSTEAENHTGTITHWRKMPAPPAALSAPKAGESGVGK